MKSKDFEIRTPFLGVGDPLEPAAKMSLHIYTYLRRFSLSRNSDIPPKTRHFDVRMRAFPTYNYYIRVCVL